MRALRSLVLRRGLRSQALAPGLLAVETDSVETLIADACRDLSSVEAGEVRCMVVDGPQPFDAAMVAQAMAAPTLAAATARVVHADLLPLFEDEQRCFHSVYQPIVTLNDQRTFGYEALLRAETPAGEAVMPDVLFPAAEAAGWLHLLDRVGRTIALRDAGPWLGEELLFINFIPTSIYRPEVCLRTTEIAAAQAGVRLDQLVFEVTEGHQVEDVDHLERVFDYYRSHHCRVALDDLGAGYSSLNLLVRLQPDIVKLDKDLVQALPGPTSRAVVTAIVDIAHSYGGLVLAECVETAQQADAATELGVDLAQGWLYGRPERRATVPRLSSKTSTTITVAPVRPELPDVAVALAHDAGAQGAAVGSEDLGLPELLLRAVDAGVSGVVVVDMLAGDQPVIYVNPAFERMTGYPHDAAIGRNCRFLQGPDTDPAAVGMLARALREGREHRTVLRNYRKDGTTWWNELHLSPVHDEHLRLTHYLGFQHDVTKRIEIEQELLRQSAHDDVTGLPNRASLVEHVELALTHARANQRAVAVLFMDLDGFRSVNNTFGRAAGDSVLLQTAERTRSVIRIDDLLARLGGDEFVAVLADLDPLDAARIAQRAAEDIVLCLRRPFTVGEAQAAIGASVGVSIYPDDTLNGETLLEAADAAMHEAKSGGHGVGRAARVARL